MIKKNENVEIKTPNFVTIAIFAVFVILFGFIAFFGSWYTVSSGHTAILLTLNKPSEITYGEGFHFKIPIIQKPIKMSLQTQKYETQAGAASRDLQTVNTNIAVNYRLQKESIISIYREIGLDFENKIIQPVVQEVVKAITSKFTADELITKRQQVSDEINLQLKERLTPRGLFVEAISITNFEFSQSFNAAIEAKVTAEQDALKAKNEWERIKIEKEQTITRAEAEAQSIRTRAEAEAYALSVVRAELEKSKQLVNYKAVEKWNGELPYVSGGAMPFIDISGAKVGAGVSE